MEETDGPHFLSNPPDLEVIHGPETEQEHYQVEIVFDVDFEEVNIWERAVVDIVVLRVLDAIGCDGHYEERKKDSERGEGCEDGAEMAQILALRFHLEEKGSEENEHWETRGARVEDEHVEVFGVAHVHVAWKRGPNGQRIRHKQEHKVAAGHEIIEDISACVDDLSFLENEDESGDWEEKQEREGGYGHDLLF